MQKTSVRTLSIIDTISELAQNESEATQLIRPYVGDAASPAAVNGAVNGGPSAANGDLTRSSLRAAAALPSTEKPAPKLKPRSPRVNVPVPQSTSTPKRHLPASSSANMLLSSAASDAAAARRRRSAPASAVASRGQTPEWIRDIFANARRGNMDRLVSSLDGLESTLIRNLTDHVGNNLLHVICAHGHSSLLPWVTRRFGVELDGAMADENRRGLTPASAAIKVGRLECVQWLVRNSSNMRDCLVGKDGERQRSLLHTAAKFGQDSVVSWLAEEMSRHDLDVNQRDRTGNSPLHLAAREGNISTVAALLHHGALIEAKNDFGLKAVDCARLAKRGDCAEFLLLFETSMGVARGVVEARAHQDALHAEAAELKTLFRDVLGTARKLSKERDDVFREVGRLYDAMLELHNNMTMEIQVLSQENASLRRNGFRKHESESVVTGGSIDACTALHERWQDFHRQYGQLGGAASAGSSVAADCAADHKLLVIEENWRRLRSSGAAASLADDSYVHRHLRDLIEDTRNKCQPLPSLAQSIFSSPEASDEDEEEDAAVISDSMAEDEQVRVRRNIARRKKLPTPTPSHHHHGRAHSSGSMEDSIYSSLSNDMYSKIGSPAASATPLRTPRTADEANNNQRSREELKQKLKECSLVSESGTASVIEVIEPTSSEEEEFKKTIRDLNLTWGGFGTTPTRSSLTRNAPKKYSDGESSPTKRLLEMGISPRTLRETIEDPKNSAMDEVDDTGKKSPQTTFFQKIALKAKWKKRASGRKEDEKSGDDIEEHILPDSFEEVVGADREKALRRRSGDGGLSSGGSHSGTDDQSSAANRKSLSPASRKSLYGSKTTMMTEAVSVATSDDSGIVLLRPTSRASKQDSRPGSSSPTTRPPPDSLPSAVITTPSETRLGKIEEVSVSSASRCSSAVQEVAEPRRSGIASSSSAAVSVATPSAAIIQNAQGKIMTPLSLLRKKSLESKAWYDVPSDEERELEPDEADDSLASIISARGSSDED